MSRLLAARHRALVALAAVISVVALSPAGASATTTLTFGNSDPEFPIGNANGLFGPAAHYPSTIELSGLEGTVVGVRATLLGFGSGSGDDIDMALMAPGHEEAVMLMSDACGEAKGFSSNTWTFDDAAPFFLSNLGPCPSGLVASFKPSNYVGNDGEDDLSREGEGPEGPYSTSLASLTGGTPNGSWDLYVLDDSPSIVGFEIAGWTLTLEVEPPPPAPAPAPIVLTAPGPTVFLPATPAPTTAAATKTGRRAAALARCKGKATPRARARCRAKARKLPV